MVLRGHLLTAAPSAPLYPPIRLPSLPTPCGLPRGRQGIPPSRPEKIPAPAPTQDADAVFCALGTTRGQAGSAEAFREIDQYAVEEAATASKVASNA